MIYEKFVLAALKIDDRNGILPAWIRIWTTLTDLEERFRRFVQYLVSFWHDSRNEAVIFSDICRDFFV